MSRPARQGSESPVEHAVMALLRRDVAERAAAGVDDASQAKSTLAARLEDDQDGRTLLEESATARRLRDRLGEDNDGPRQRRIDREAEVHAAVGQLLLEGGLVADGLDRVVLPGFGAGTWRAIASLRVGSASPSGWEAAVAAGPAEDLGMSAPPFLLGLRPDARLAEPAARLHLLQAHRQDVRNALLVAQFATGVAIDADNVRGVESLRSEAEACARQLEVLDAEIEAAWDIGRMLALGYAPPP